MTDELKPCPFCKDGGSPILSIWGNNGWGGEFDRTGRVSCKTCLTGGPIVAGRDDGEVSLLAAAAWNRRPGCDGCKHKGTPASDKGFICLYCTRNFLDLYEPKDNEEQED